MGQRYVASSPFGVPIEAARLAVDATRQEWHSAEVSSEAMWPLVASVQSDTYGDECREMIHRQTVTLDNALRSYQFNLVIVPEDVNASVALCATGRGVLLPAKDQT